MRAFGLAVPASDAGEPVRDVFDLDVERGGVEQVETPPAQHALPRACAEIWRGVTQFLCALHGLMRQMVSLLVRSIVCELGQEEMDESRT